jgi:hypothetical protein
MVDWHASTQAMQHSIRICTICKIYRKCKIIMICEYAEYAIQAILGKSATRADPGPGPTGRAAGDRRAAATMTAWKDDSDWDASHGCGPPSRGAAAPGRRPPLSGSARSESSVSVRVTRPFGHPSLRVSLKVAGGRDPDSTSSSIWNLALYDIIYDI